MAKRSSTKKTPPWLGALLLAFFIICILYYGWAKWLNYELQETRTKLSNHQLEAALPHIRLLKILQPGSPANDFLYAAAIRETDPEAAINSLEKLAKNPESKYFNESALIYLELCIQLKRREQADEIIQILGPRMGDNPKYMVLHARNFIQKGDYMRAMDELTYALKISPANSEAQWLRAQILLTQPRVTNWIEAKSALREAGQMPDAFGLEALITMGSRSEIQLFPDEREWLIHQIEKHPKADVRARLVVATQKVLLNGSNKDEIVQETIESEGEITPLAVANWLLAINEPKIAQDYLDQLKMDPSPALWEAQYNTALQNQDYERVKLLLDAENSVATEGQRETIKVIIDLNSLENQTPEHWEVAYELISESQDRSSMLALAQAAGRQHWWAESEKAYRKAIDFSPGQVMQSNIKAELMTVLLARHKTAEALAIATELRELFPLEPIYQNNYYYFRALLGNGGPDQTKQFAAMMERIPVSSLNATYAFLLYQDGNYDLAEEKLKKLPEWLHRQADIKLLKGLIAEKKGEKEHALQLISQINPDNLLPEENALREEALEALSNVNN